MLHSLYIKNYLLIDELQIHFNIGLTTITGETGAGKSIILGALSLILGERANVKGLLNDKEKCVVEGQFNIKNYHLIQFFEDYDLDYNDICILRREVIPSGKSRAFINDTPVGLPILKELATKLVDLHSQFANTLVGSEAFRMQLIDSFGETSLIYNDYYIQYLKFIKLELEVKELQHELDIAHKDIDYYQFQSQQISEAKLDSDTEVSDLEDELQLLEHAEEIKIGLNEAFNIFDREEFGILFQIKQCKVILEKLGKHSSGASELATRMGVVQVELKDIANEIESLEHRVDINPMRIEHLTARLDLIHVLLNKFKAVDISELRMIYTDFLTKIGSTSALEQKLEEKSKELTKLEATLKKQAELLSKKRTECFKLFEQKVLEILMQMGMPKVRFRVEHQQNSRFNVFGIDKINFLFSANLNGIMQAVEDAASGGEMSRIMLCLKSLMNEKAAVATLIFDEIDTGVSGEIADSMGQIMKKMAAKQQIISITHLPQVAANGTHQFKVFKQNTDKGTHTLIKQLSESERVEEIASMLSGKIVTETARKNAKILLSMASKL
jgi:DNA repair protein RecN (Recombination protein N)